MSSHTILQDEVRANQFLCPKSKSNSVSVFSFAMRHFTVPAERAGEPTYSNTNINFWEIRRGFPPSDDIIAHVGDIYLDISTNPVGVYQNTSTEWVSCWSDSESTSSKKEFLKLQHPLYKDHFIWTTANNQSNPSTGIILSYITQQELNSRGGTEKHKQVFLRKDLNTFRSITTAETYVARKNSKAALQTGEDACLDSLDSLDSSSSSTMDAGNDSDSMYVEKDMCEDGDEDGDGDDDGDEDGDGDEDEVGDDDGDGDEDGDHGDVDVDEDDEGDGDDDDKTAEVVSGSDSVDKANKDAACCETAEVAELAKTILEEVRDISSTISSLFKNPASGSVPVPPGISPSSSSTSFYPLPKFESDSIHSLLSRLTAAIEKERNEHLTKINNCE